MPQADDCCRPGAWTMAFRAGFPLAVTFLLLAPAWTLPWSLIDDGVFLDQTMRLNQALAALHFREWWSLLWTPEINRYGPGMFVQLQFMHLLGGLHAGVWHVLKSGAFLVLLMSLVEIVRLAGYGRSHAVIAVLCFALLGKPSLFSDIQTHAANWMRLNTTDSHAMWLEMLAIAALFRALTAEEARGFRTSTVIAAVTHGLAMLTKINIVACLAALLAGLGLLAVLAARERKPVRRFVIAAIVLTVASLPGLIYFRPYAMPQIEVYDTTFSLSPARVGSGIAFALWTFAEAWGPCLFVTLPFVPVRIAHVMRSDAHAARRLFWILIPGAAATAFILQSGWHLLMPRYMVNYTPFVSLITGVLIGEALRVTMCHLKERNCAHLLPSVCVIGALLFFAAHVILVMWMRSTLLRLVPVAALLVLSACVVLLAFRGPRRIRPAASLCAAGLAFGCLLEQLFVMCIAANEARASYFAFEKANWQVVQSALDEARATSGHEDPLVVHTNLRGEWGVQASFLARILGGQGKLRVVPESVPDSLSPNERLCVLSHNAHFDLRMDRPVSGGWRVAAVEAGPRPDRVVLMQPGSVTTRVLSLPERSVISGYELAPVSVTWPWGTDIEVTFRDESGLRASGRVNGVYSARMGAETERVVLSEPFALQGEALTVHVEVKPTVPGTGLSRYQAGRGYLAFSAVPQEGIAVPWGRPLIAVSDRPAFTLVRSDTVTDKAPFLWPFGTVAELWVAGQNVRDPLLKGGRVCGWRYQVDLWRPAAETGE